MEKKSFLVYFDSYPWVRLLTLEEKGLLLDALFRYADRVQEEDVRPEAFLASCPELPGNAVLVFGFMAGNVYRDTLKWKRRARARGQSRPAAGERAGEEGLASALEFALETEPFLRRDGAERA